MREARKVKQTLCEMRPVQSTIHIDFLESRDYIIHQLKHIVKCIFSRVIKNLGIIFY